jgi:hypothetical protein
VLLAILELLAPLLALCNTHSTWCCLQGGANQRVMGIAEHFLFSVA